MGRFRRTATWSFGVVLAGALYLLLIDTLDSPELYAGAVVVAIGALAFDAAREQGFAEARPSIGWLPRLPAALVRIPADVGRLALSLAEQLGRPRARRGELRALPFVAGAADDARDAARRALAEAAGSLAPNTIVIGVDADRDLMLVHQLRRSGGAETVDPLGLG